MRGAAVHLASKAEAGEVRLLSERIHADWITVMQAGPSLWKSLVLETGTLLSDLTVVVDGTDELSAALLTELTARAFRVLIR